MVRGTSYTDFMLFWDGFEISKGRSASGDGLYLLCFNMPLKARLSSTAVRIVSLAPPGLKSDALLKVLHEDIVKGMTEGFTDYDATGQKCRIFLDLVGFLGDTPALNSSLDTLGHTSTAFCHLCRYRKQPTTFPGSQNAGSGSHGHLTGTARSFYIHAAIRDSKAQKETCRLLGMKYIQNENDLPLHSLRRVMMDSRSRIQSTAEGHPILTGYLDPYMSCFIAPDHLLTGHLKTA